MPMSVLMVWGAIITSILASLAFMAALVIAYLTHDTASQQQLVGAIIATFATVVAFWVGSSAGSQKKDERAADSPREQNRLSDGARIETPPKDKPI
jgi:ABC-type uncharacterized transport system permease subunit